MLHALGHNLDTIKTQQPVTIVKQSVKLYRLLDCETILQ